MKEQLGTQLESGALLFVRDLPGPIERVWAYLVEPEKRALWFCGGTMGDKPGDAFTLAFDHHALSEEAVPDRFAELKNGIEMGAHIVTIEPPRLLVFRWDEDSVETRIELEPIADRVKLTLTQLPPPDLAERLSMAAGWQAHLGLLIDRLNGHEPRGFWSEHAEAEEQYRPLIG